SGWLLATGAPSSAATWRSGSTPATASSPVCAPRSRVSPSCRSRACRARMCQRSAASSPSSIPTPVRPLSPSPRSFPTSRSSTSREAAREGNARIVGPRFEAVLMAQAARHVIVTAERIVDGAEFEEVPELVAIPGFMVDSVVEAPRGAWPCSCAGFYDYDAEYLAEYVTASKDEDAFQRFVETHVFEFALVGAR